MVKQEKMADYSEDGLAIVLVKSYRGLQSAVNTFSAKIRKDTLLFGEALSQSHCNCFSCQSS